MTIRRKSSEGQQWSGTLVEEGNEKKMTAAVDRRKKLGVSSRTTAAERRGKEVTYSHKNCVVYI